MINVIFVVFCINFPNTPTNDGSRNRGGEILYSNILLPLLYCEQAARGVMDYLREEVTIGTRMQANLKNYQRWKYYFMEVVS